MPKFSVVEKIQIDVDISKVRAAVRDFRQWVSWSPWLAAEPNCPLKYADDGMSYSWDGKDIGSGEMQITSEDDNVIHYDLAFFRPWKSRSKVAFRFVPNKDGTEVVWSMDGSLPFLMFFMKKMMSAWIGADYRRGLSKLKDYAETGTVASQNEFVGLGDGLASHYVGLRANVSMSEVGDTMAQQFGQLKKWIEDKAIETNGPPVSIYHKFKMVEGRADYTAAVLVKSVPSDLPAGFVSGKLDAPRTYKVTHTGAYRHLGSAWSAGMMHQRNKHFRPDKSCPPFELYVSDPETTLEIQRVTEIHFPAK